MKLGEELNPVLPLFKGKKTFDRWAGGGLLFEIEFIVLGNEGIEFITLLLLNISLDLGLLTSKIKLYESLLGTPPVLVLILGANSLLEKVTTFSAGWVSNNPCLELN